MVVNLMFRGRNYYSSVPGERLVNCRYSEKKTCERKTRNIQKGVSSKVKLTNLGGGSSFNINKSGDKSKVNMDNR